jgi:integral membrane protein (TIGR01906 family)
MAAAFDSPGQPRDHDASATPRVAAIMSILARVAAAFFILALPLFLVTTNVRVLASDVGFYKRGLRNYNAAETTGIALPELDRASGEIIDYFENDAGTLRILVNEGGQEASLFNARETEHMRDVKTLMNIVYRANEGSLAFVLVYVTAVFLWARERSLRSLAWLGLGGVAAGFVFVAAIGVVAAAGGFDQAWNEFHLLVFSNDFWRLNPDTDHLIQMFPEPFWQDATVIAGALTVAEAALVSALAGGYLFATRKRRAPLNPRTRLSQRTGADPR